MRGWNRAIASLVATFLDRSRPLNSFGSRPELNLHFPVGGSKNSRPVRQLQTLPSKSLSLTRAGVSTRHNHACRSESSLRRLGSTWRAQAYSTVSDAQSRRNTSAAMYFASVIIAALGASYGAVPLYKIFCQATGFGGTPKVGHGGSRSSTDSAGQATGPTKVAGARPIRVTFNADVSDRLEWSFRPQQREVRIVPGETALVFYTAKNMSKQDIVGIAAYNVTPNKAGQYFNKIQCFCFEYQRLAAGEEVDMPAFFYIDPEFADDPQMRDVDTITLSYTFFEAKEASRLASFASAKNAA